METEPHSYGTLIDRYFAIWNEVDAAQRQAMIAETWSDTATYRDPMMEGAGHAGIDALVAGVQAQFAGYRFRQTGPLDAYADRLRFSWELAPADGPALVRGTDFGIVAADGRLAAITGFLDHVAANPAAH